MSERDDGLYIADIQTAIQKIEKYIKGLTFEKLVRDDKTYDAVMRQLTILGEAASQTSTAFKNAHPAIPWHKIIGLRNRLMHEYSNINNDIVWDTCTNDLPVLKASLGKE